MPAPEAIFFVVWFFVIGGVIGSFVNVVVHRLPKGMSLIEPPSHCPKCKRRIRWYDNVPIFGWLWLRGKCRDCKQPISPRYPLVELTVALMFGSLMAMEFALEGFNLPVREIQVNDIVEESAEFAVVVTSSADYFLIVLYHMLLLGVLFCGALIEYDRDRPPARMYVWTILLGLVFPLQWVFLHPMKAWANEPKFFAGGIEGLCGLAAGGVLGYIAYRLQGSRQAGALPLGLVCVGVFLGWQAVLPLGILAAILGIVTATVISQKRQAWLIPASAWLWILTIIWILFWKQLVPWINLT